MQSTDPYPKALAQHPTLRQSLLSAYDLCALEAVFSLRYTTGWATQPQARGRAFHSFATRALTEMSRHNEDKIEVDLALAILHEVLRQDDIDRICPSCETTVIEPGINKGMRTCGNGHRFQTDLTTLSMGSIQDLYWVVKKWAYDNEFNIANLVDVEKRLDATVRYVKDGIGTERKLTGQLDALFVEGDYDDHAICLDWKETWGLPAPTEVSFEGYFQQRFYGWLVMRNYRSIERVTLREFYVRYSEPREAVVYREQLDDIEAELTALAERFDRSVQEDVWVPSPGKHCGYCPRPEACPIPKFARGEGKIEAQEDAERTARSLLVANAVVKQNRAALQAWADIHGPVPIRDAKGVREWGYRQIERVDRPDRDTMEHALAAGHVNLDTLYRKRKSAKFEAHVPKPRKVEEEDALLLAALTESVNESKARVSS